MAGSPVSTPPPPVLWNVPNLLTLGRLGLAVVLFVFIELRLWLACLITFGLAALTDWLDGYFARLFHQGSAFGRNFDPLVDKVLVGGAFIFLLPIPQAGLAAWMVTVVIVRELLITGLRSFVETKGANFGADRLGKLKMLLQCATLAAIFVELTALEMATPAEVPALSWLRIGLTWAMLLATVVSGLHHLYRALPLLKEE